VTPAMQETAARVERAAGSPRRAAMKQRFVLAVDVRDVLPAIAVPTLVVQSVESPGVRVGEVELRGDDVGGIAVHTAARVAALAGPGEVLVSQTVRDLVAGSGLEFSDRGLHHLKGVPGEWRLFALAP
jgi:hypothetical protein